LSEETRGLAFKGRLDLPLYHTFGSALRYFVHINH
jgi:hypothetical protein